MKVNKNFINGIRSSLKESYNNKRLLLEQLNILEERLSESTLRKAIAVPLGDKAHFSSSNNGITDEFFGKIDKRFAIDNPTTRSELETTKKIIDCLENDVARIDSILKSYDGGIAQSVTYGLPFLCYAVASCSPFLCYLMMAGIKRNADEKVIDALGPNEAVLADLEIKMGQFIDDDGRLSIENAQELLKLFGTYIKYFDSFILLDVDRPVNEDEVFSAIMVSVASYIVYCETGVVMSFAQNKRLSEVAKKIMEEENVDLVSALEKAAKKCIEEFRVQKTIENGTHQEREADAIDEYVVGGVVVKSCDMTTFDELLSNSGLSQEKREEYRMQMSCFLAEEEKRNRVIVCERIKSELFSKEERALYWAAKLNPEQKDIAAGIDQVVEMMSEMTTSDDFSILMEELHRSFYTLTSSYGELARENANVIYYVEESDDGYVPKLLRSVIKDKKQNYEEVHGQLTRLLGNFVGGDREIKNSCLPCRIWMKGKNYRIFYTAMNGVTIVIDSAFAEEGFDRLFDLCSSQEFTNFLDEVKSSLESGIGIDHRSYSEMIMSELAKSNAVSKKM